MKPLRSVLCGALVGIATVGPVSGQVPAGVPFLVAPTIASGGEVAATTAAEVWLAMVDDGRYANSWQSAASIFKTAVSQERWVTMLGSYRQPLGKPLLRALKSKQSTRTLPGAPDGQYVVILYDTTFEHKNSSVETLTCVLDVSGSWRVSGYFVR